jgi:hypothetical protein
MEEVRGICTGEPDAMMDDRNPEFVDQSGRIREKCGTELLSDDELLLLACEEISRTTTYRELGYSRTGQ